MKIDPGRLEVTTLQPSCLLLDLDGTLVDSALASQPA